MERFLGGPGRLRAMIGFRLSAALGWAGAVLSGILLAVSFPPFGWRDAAWAALIPLLFAARAVPPFAAFRRGVAAGAVFWLVSIHWLTHVTVAGWIGLSLYLALYVGVFAMVSSWWLRRFGAGFFASNLGFMAAAALAWAGLEHIRSVLLTGFPWIPLGASQYTNTTIIQMASWGGVAAVSALVVWVNSAIALTLMRYADRRWRWGRQPHPELMFGCALLAAAFLFGMRELRAIRDPGTPLNLVLIQTAIPQDEKWDAEKFELIYRRLWDLTAAALRVGSRDLIVWPETALPDDVLNSASSYSLVYDLLTNGTPILVGSMDTRWPDDGDPCFYNSSFLFDTEGHAEQFYDKRHLVAFGEYVPFERFLPFVSALTPIQASFTPGQTSTVFRLASPDVAFSVLICFEDAVAALARESVRNGARLLINQTNDAWFDPSGASWQHMIHCIFRCIENRVPAVRATNSGVTCCIDRMGRVTAVLRDADGGVIFPGFKSAVVNVPGADAPPTFYTRHGDLLAQMATLFAAVFAAAVVWVERRTRTASP